MNGVFAIILACSYCAMRENAAGRMLLLWGMILLPFSVVGLSLYAIRKMMRSESEDAIVVSKET